MICDHRKGLPNLGLFVEIDKNENRDYYFILFIFMKPNTDNCWSLDAHPPDTSSRPSLGSGGGDGMHLGYVF